MNQWKKGIACFFVFLFLITVFIPVANKTSVQAQCTDDVILRIEVSGLENQTVRLSAAQYQELEAYLQEFQKRVNATRSLDETKALYKEALEQFESLRLFPKGYSAESLYAQICRNLLKHGSRKLLEIGSNNIKNRFCLVSGRATNVWFQNIIIQTAEGLGYQCGEIMNKIMDKIIKISMENRPLAFLIYLCILPPLFVLDLFYSLYDPLGYILWFTPFIFSATPSSVGQVVGLGVYGGGPFIYDYEPSLGWISTKGSAGSSNNSGNICGSLPIVPIQIPYSVSYPALYGFTGVKIYSPSGTCFFMGSAIFAHYSVTPLHT